LPLAVDVGAYWLGAGGCIARIVSSKPGVISSQGDFRCQKFPSARAARRSPSLARHRGAVVRPPWRMLEGHSWLISPGRLIAIDPAADAQTSAFLPGAARRERFSSPWIDPQGVDPRRSIRRRAGFQRTHLNHRGSTDAPVMRHSMILVARLVNDSLDQYSLFFLDNR
jgi:hypothetical protein